MISCFKRSLRVAIFLLVAVVVDFTILVQARIIKPFEKEICLTEGDTLHFICEEGNDLPGSPTVQPSAKTNHLRWTRKRFHETSYSSMEQNEGFYTTAAKTDGKETRELWKHNVSFAESAEYRCQNFVTPSDTVNVTVIKRNKVFVRNATIEKVNDDAKLECFPTELPPESWNVTWFRAGQKVESKPKKYTLGLENGTLTVHRVGEKDIGEYTCTLNLTAGSMTKVIHLHSFPFVKSFEKSQNIREGSALRLRCIVWGWPTPLVTWYRNEQPLNESIDQRLSFPNDSSVAHSRLLLEPVNFSDRAIYMCSASSSLWPAVASNSTILVRIKGRLAFLWPFLGICVEAIVLSIIIFVYEKNRMKKKEADEANCDGSKQQANCTASSNADNLRHRK